MSPEQIQTLMQAQGAQPGFAPGMPAGESKRFLLQHGALVEVMISSPPSAAGAMEAAGQAPGAPQKLVLMVDTGASITGVRDSVATSLGLVATSSVQVGGVAGTQTAAIYAAKIEMPKYNVTFDAVQIAGFQLPGQEAIDGLMGRDMLEKLVLLYNGPEGTFAFQGGTPESVSPMSTIAAGAIAALAFGSLLFLGK
jgi:aspartyl protease